MAITHKREFTPAEAEALAAKLVAVMPDIRARVARILIVDKRPIQAEREGDRADAR